MRSVACCTSGSGRVRDDMMILRARRRRDQIAHCATGLTPGSRAGVACDMRAKMVEGTGGAVSDVEMVPI